MHINWLASSARHISQYRRPLKASSIGRGSLPPGRGMLWAIIHRRQTFCERIQSPAIMLDYDPWRTNLFSGMEFQIRQLLPGQNV